MGEKGDQLARNANMFETTANLNGQNLESRRGVYFTDERRFGSRFVSPTLQTTYAYRQDRLCIVPSRLLVAAMSECAYVETRRHLGLLPRGIKILRSCTIILRTVTLQKG